MDSRKSLKGRITAEFQPGAAHEKYERNLEETLHGGKKTYFHFNSRFARQKHLTLQHSLNLSLLKNDNVLGQAITIGRVG